MRTDHRFVPQPNGEQPDTPFVLDCRNSCGQPTVAQSRVPLGGWRKLNDRDEHSQRGQLVLMGTECWSPPGANSLHAPKAQLSPTPMSWLRLRTPMGRVQGGMAQPLPGKGPTMLCDGSGRRPWGAHPAIMRPRPGRGIAAHRALGLPAAWTTLYSSCLGHPGWGLSPA